MPNDENVATQSASLENEDLETSLLEALQKKGPALPVELAVRTYSFPEEIAESLVNLEQKGFVERQAMKAGEMVVLTNKGQQEITSG